MVQFGVPTVEEAMKLGREAADHISETFIKVCPNLLFYFRIFGVLFLLYEFSGQSSFRN